MAQLKKGYKKSEVGVIPEDWLIASIGSQCQIFGRIGFRGYTVNDIVNEAQGAITLSPSNIINGKLNLSKLTYLSWFKYEESPEIKIYNEDILLVKTGSTFGKTTLVRNLNYKATLNPQIVVLKKVKCNNSFLGFMMGYPIIQNQIISTVVGGAIPTLSQEQVSRFKFPLPPTLTEQKAIADALTDVDELITNLQKLIAKKKAIKQGAMQQLLTPPHKGGKRLDGFSGDWVEVKLGQISSIYQPTTISQEQLKNDGYLVYGANGIIGFYDKYNHEKWQVTITCRGSTCGTVNKTMPKSWITGNAMVINVDENKNISKSFLYHLLSNSDFTSCITGSGQPQIVRAPLSDYSLWMPLDLNEQVRIAEMLDEIELELSQVRIKIKKAVNIKQGMMQELLTGKTRLI